MRQNLQGHVRGRERCFYRAGRTTERENAGRTPGRPWDGVGARGWFFFRSRVCFHLPPSDFRPQ